MLRLKSGRPLFFTASARGGFFGYSADLSAKAGGECESKAIDCGKHSGPEDVHGGRALVESVATESVEVIAGSLSVCAGRDDAIASTASNAVTSRGLGAAQEEHFSWSRRAFIPLHRIVLRRNLPKNLEIVRRAREDSALRFSNLQLQPPVSFEVLLPNSCYRRSYCQI